MHNMQLNRFAPKTCGHNMNHIQVLSGFLGVVATYWTLGAMGNPR